MTDKSTDSQEIQEELEETIEVLYLACSLLERNGIEFPEKIDKWWKGNRFRCGTRGY